MVYMSSAQNKKKLYIGFSESKTLPLGFASPFDHIYPVIKIICLTTTVIHLLRIKTYIATLFLRTNFSYFSIKHTILNTLQ